MSKKEDFIILKYIGSNSVKLAFTKTPSLEPVCDDFNTPIRNCVFVNLVKDSVIKVLNDDLTKARIDAAQGSLVNETEKLKSLNIGLNDISEKARKEFEAEKKELEQARKEFEAEKKAFLKEKESFQSNVK